MSGGISPNKLNGISKAYLDMVTDINKKGQEDDVNRWTQKEETACKSESPFKKKKYKEDWQPEIEHSKLGDAKKKADKKRESKLPPHLRGDAIGKMKKAFANEGYSDWRTSLREVTSDAEATDIDNQPEIKEKKVKNKIKINPSFLEAVKEMGGELLEVKELDDADAAKDEKASQKEKRLKLRLLRTKMMAVKQGADDSIVAGYEPKGEMVEGAVATIKKVTKAGVKRHKKAVEDKKIKDRKAVPYAALAAEHQPEGEVIDELNRYEKETGKSSGSLNMPKGKPTKKGGDPSPVMRSVRKMMRSQEGKPEGQRKKVKGKKPPKAGEYGARRSPEEIVKKRRWDKKRADDAMRDTSGT